MTEPVLEERLSGFLKGTEEYRKGLDSRLVRIEDQCKKTNGRVSKLETWQAFLQGGLAVIIVLIIPIVLFIVQQWISGKL